VILSAAIHARTGALIAQLVDTDARAVQDAWTALGEVTAMLPKDSLHLYVRCVRDAVTAARDKERCRCRKTGAEVLVAGFCLPKGLSPVLPIYLHALLSGGSAESREEAADAIGELVTVTSEESVKPHIITITGPLIRVISDKVQWSVKAAILQTLSIVIAKGSAALKPFLPQLQTTFVKCLQDSARTVRMRAAGALGLLMQLQTRLDPLCTELVNGLHASDVDAGIREAMTVALRDVIKKAGAHITQPTLERIVADLQQEVPGQTDEAHAARASALGAAATFLPAADFDALLGTLLTAGAATGDTRLNRAAALCAILELVPARVAGSAAASRVDASIRTLASDARAEVRQLAARAAGLLLVHQLATGATQTGTPGSLAELLALTMRDESSDVRRRALSVLKRVAKVAPAAAFTPLLPVLLPPAVEALTDRVSPVKLVAERAVRRCCWPSAAIADGIESAQALVSAAGAPLRSKLTDAVLRRLSKLPDDSDDEE
jgi:hypothetical protein